MTEFVWALVGPGAIARRFAEAVDGLDDARLHKVCGRDATRTDSFIAACPNTSGRPLRAAQGMSDILDDPLVDGIYVATPHAQHGGFVRQCLEAGKDANLIFLNGDPFEPGTQIQAVMLEGDFVSGEVDL